MRVALALIVSLTLPTPAMAANPVNRCLDASGTTVFTDRPCSQHGASAMPRTGHVASESAQSGPRWSGSHGLVTGGLPNPQTGCAADPADLALRLRVALESRDVNQLASLYHWPGASSRGAESIMGSLGRTAARGVYAVEVEPGPTATMAMASTTTVAPPPRGLRVDHGPTGFEGYPPETTRFAIVRHMGCWWVHY